MSTGRIRRQLATSGVGPDTERMAIVDRADRARPEVGPPGAGPKRTSRAEDLIFVSGLFWTMIGLQLDGWAHRHRPELESFFTPWHAIFYSGFIATCAWFAVLILRRLRAGRSVAAAVPPGYELSVIGLGLFAVGGVADGFWHTVFGVESSLDALLSPTHLVMLVGMLLAATAPFRAAWREPGDRSATLRDLLPPLLSLIFAIVAVAFFFMYVNGFDAWAMDRTYDPEIAADEISAALGVLGAISTTLILFGALFLVHRRWRLPFGTATLLFTIPAAFLTLLDALAYPWQIVPAVVGGLAVDATLARYSNGPGDRRAARLCGLVGPLVMWSVGTALTHLFWGIEWPPELWLGTICLATLAGVGLAFVAYPPPHPTGPVTGQDGDQKEEGTVEAANEM